MHKKFVGIIVTAGVLAFFLLAVSTSSYAETAGTGLKAAALLAKQALQQKSETNSVQADSKSAAAQTQTPGPTKSTPTPKPTKPTPTPKLAPTPKPAATPTAKPKQFVPQMQFPTSHPRPLPPAGPKPEGMPKPAKAQPSAKTAPPSAQPPVPSAAMKGAVSFNFDDADVYSVIQTVFGDVLRVNYVIDPMVRGRVTFRSVEPVAKKDVLPLMEVILRLNGIGIVQEGGLYRIIPIADISKEPAPVEIGRNPDDVKITGKALVQIVQIKYMKSSEMVQILKPFLSKNAVVVDVPDTNYVVIVDTDSNVKRLLKMVNLFDTKELEAVTPRVFVYAVQNGKAKDVANLLQQIFLGAKPATKSKVSVTSARRNLPGRRPTPQHETQIITSEGGGSGSMVSDVTKIIPDEVTNSLIILATPDDYRKIKEAIAKIDISPRQVVIEALIVQVNLTDNLSFGLSWSLDTDMKMHPFKKDVNLGGNVQQAPGGLNLGATTSPIPANGFSFIGYDPTGNVRAVLTALEDRNKAKVVAAPHILVSDNKEASIQIGQQIPLATSTSSIPTTSTTTEGTTNTNAVAVVGTSTIQYKDIGIILKVKPQVNDSGLINLDFSQEISSVGGSVQVGGLSEVTINKTEAKSNLVAQDGETIVIGGLIRQDKSHGRSGIPFLSRIPVIGALFGDTTNTSTRSELIILLTPHVVRNEQEAKSVSSQYINRYKSVTKDEEIEKFINRPKGTKKDVKGSGQKGGSSPAITPIVSP